MCWANFFTHTLNSHVLTINVLKLHIRYIGQCRNNGMCTNVHREMCIRIRNYRWFTIKAIRCANGDGVCVVCLCVCIALYHFRFVVSAVMAAAAAAAAIAIAVLHKH